MVVPRQSSCVSGRGLWCNQGRPMVMLGSRRGEVCHGPAEAPGRVVRGANFDREVILLCVRWYLRFKLSLRDLVEMMAERGLSLAHTTIMRWVQHYTPEFGKRW